MTGEGQFAEIGAVEYLRRFPATEQQQPGIDAALVWLETRPTSAPSQDADAVTPWPLNDSITALSQMIDDSYPPGLDPEAHLWRRVVKVKEERGEVIESVLGMLGENPRKGRTHEVGDVRKELFDVALAALGAAAHIDGNNTDVAAMFQHHAHHVRTRLHAAIHSSTSSGSVDR